MIKGHMTIELADAKTGKVIEKHEDDNLVTNAIKHYFKNMGMFNVSPVMNTSGSLFNVNPQNVVIPLFGGLLLFDTAQTENAEHIFVSGGTKMTGNGINDYTSNDSVTEFGSYNSEESGWQEDGSFKQVWDFTTTQANGTIACACLVPKNYGAWGEGNGTSRAIKTSATNMGNVDFYQYSGHAQGKYILNPPATFFGTGFEAYPIYINTEDNYAILLAYKAGNAMPQQFKYVKVAFPWNKVDLRDGIQNWRVLGEVHDITLPSQLSASRAWINRPHSFIGRDNEGAFYIAVNTVSYNSVQFNAQYPLQIIKFVIGANDVVTCEYVMSITPSLIGQTTGTYYYTNPNHLEIVNKNLFLATSTTNALDRTKWFKINTETQVVEALEDLTASNFQLFMGTNSSIAIPDSNSIYFDGSTQNSVKVDLTAKTVTSLNGTGGNAHTTTFYGLIDGKCALLYSTGEVNNYNVIEQVYRYTHFLSTINNLESPVVKTPDKTMKVTYVLRFDET